MAQAKPKNKKSFSGAIKFVILLASLICFPIGINLLASSKEPEFVADGISQTLDVVGKIITIITAIPLIIYIISLIVSQVKTYISRNKEGAINIFSNLHFMKRLPKNILLPIIVMVVSFIFIAPLARSAIISETETRDQELFDLAIKDIEYNPLDDLVNNYQFMSETEIRTKLDEATFSHIDFGTDASSNQTSDVFPKLFGEAVYAKTSDVVVLNKAKLSSSGHFVVFYTDTGDDKISDSRAVELGEMAEAIISNYKSKLGLGYSYQKN